ncbi:tumor necrosis factor ligand superfamily member 6-like [Pseudophryne corroboree]|uniref:tumor necrosis factor ligand superfamily member 6-like n=1 Tax=Pseudophryne corroboree TaxID=495146 RepID=UPI003081EC92
MDRYGGSPVSVFTVETQDHQSPHCPPPIRKRASRGRTLIQLVLVALTLLALCGAASQIYYLRRMQSNLDAAQEMINTHFHEQKMILKPDGRPIPSAHVTGLTVADYSSSVPLQWEPTRGLAFLHDVGYSNGSLLCKTSGLYFVYSKLQLGLSNCPQTSDTSTFIHGVYTRSTDKPLMEDRRRFCDTEGSPLWKGSSFIGAAFMLEKGDEVYVRMSHKNLIRVDRDTVTFFGLFGL